MSKPTDAEVLAILPPEELAVFKARFELAEDNEEREAVLKQAGERIISIVMKKTVTEPLAKQVIRCMDGRSMVIG